MFGKPVVTVTDERLAHLARRLHERMAFAGFVPEMLVGVASGGVRVVDAFPELRDVAVLSCSLQRPSTAVKTVTGLDRFLGRLPYGASNVLRKLEDWVAERRSPSPVPANAQLVSDIELIRKTVTERGLKRVAVVDDAVDSGATLAAVMRLMRDCLPPTVEVRSAVITQTRSSDKVLVEPDFTIYNQVLCRFSWSFDFRGTA